MLLWAVVTLYLVIGPCLGMVWGPERGGDQCDAAAKESVLVDRATAADDTPTRLHSTWLSQGCETRAGPEYVIRKYTFFDNGTFLLLRHHYAEESCSVATHTIVARGDLRLLLPSIITPGATEARFRLDTVHVVPLNRQVAQKLGHRVNISCSPQPKWKPYIPQLVYEQPPHRFANPLWEGPRYNSLQGHPPSRSYKGFDCLQPLGIEYGELRLLRVQRKPTSSKGFVPGSNIRPRVELLLGSLAPNVQTRWTHRPTSLQSTALLRIDTTSGCPMCNTISHSTETSPPVLHEVAALPALLGGTWLSTGCESFHGGLWIRRRLQVWPGDKLWTGRWDHFTDPQCFAFLYGLTAAGSYVQRSGRQRHHQIERDVVFQQDEQLAGPDRIGVEEIASPLLRESYNNGEEFEQLDDGFRTKRDLAPWMTPELAQSIFDLYGPEKVRDAGMLPTVDEIKEAIGKSLKEDPSAREEAGVNDDEELRSKKEARFERGGLSVNGVAMEKTYRKHSLLPRLVSSAKKISRREINVGDPDYPCTNLKDEVEGTGLTWKDVKSSIKKLWKEQLPLFLKLKFSGKLAYPDNQDNSKLLETSGNIRFVATDEKTKDSPRTKRSLDEDHSYRHLFQNTQPSLAESFTAMLRGNQRIEDTTRRPNTPLTPVGTTELDLHVAESLLIPGDASVAARCGGTGGPLSSWPQNCIPHSLEAPSTLGLKARVGVNWSGQYTLLLGSRESSLWEAPLQQCGPSSLYNPGLKANLRRSVGLRYGLFYTSSASVYSGCFCLLTLQLVIFAFYWRMR